MPANSRIEKRAVRRKLREGKDLFFSTTHSLELTRSARIIPIDIETMHMIIKGQKNGLRRARLPPHRKFIAWSRHLSRPANRFRPTFPLATSPRKYYS